MIKLHKPIRVIALTTALIGGVVCAADETFELKNNSADSIQITLSQYGDYITKLTPIAKGRSFAFKVNTKTQTVLTIHYCPTKDACKTKLPEKLTAIIQPGKTIYVKFDGKKITPQDGNKLTDKTTSGFSTKNNVKATDIQIMNQ